MLFVLHGVGALLLYLASLQSSFTGVYSLVLLYCFCFMPTLSLTNSLAFRQMSDPATQFGVIRVLGTLGWIVAGLIIGQASGAFAIAVLAEAALSFLGLGTPPPTPSWGRMLQESQELLFVAPRLAVVPGVAIAVAVLGFNLLGDGLRDYLDPRLDDRR